MNLKKYAAGLAALSLVAAPVAAQAAMAPSIAPLNGDENSLEGGNLLLAALGAAAVIAGIVIAADSDGTQLPVSG